MIAWRLHQTWAVERSVQEELDAVGFWRSQSFAALQDAQDTTGQIDPAELAINDLTDGERVDFIEALDERR